jgi:hypothetical protein
LLRPRFIAKRIKHLNRLQRERRFPLPNYSRTPPTSLPPAAQKQRVSSRANVPGFGAQLPVRGAQLTMSKIESHHYVPADGVGYRPTSRHFDQQVPTL